MDGLLYRHVDDACGYNNDEAGHDYTNATRPRVKPPRQFRIPPTRFEVCLR